MRYWVELDWGVRLCSFNKLNDAKSYKDQHNDEYHNGIIVYDSERRTYVY